MMKNADSWIDKLNLEKHPEGGWFREVYRSEDFFSVKELPRRYAPGRNFSTSIYYLLANNDKSDFHRIQSDELWHFYTGSSSVEILLLKDGNLEKLLLGPDFDKGERFQVVIPKNTWFAAHLKNNNGFALVGCTVSPGFDFSDFELARREILLKQYPELKLIIKRFTAV